MHSRRFIWLGAIAVIVVVGVAGLVRALRPSDDPPALNLDPGGKVKRVSGDRIKLKDGRDIEFAAIRLPYEHEPYAEPARKTLNKWVEDEGVRLKFDEQYEYKEGRLLAYVYANDTFINERLVRDGLAFVKLRAGNRQHAEALLAAQAAAQEDGKGIWRTVQTTAAGALIGDSNGATFHVPDCADRPTDPACVVEIQGTADAFARGLAPCGKCRPLGT